jgi:hypothetical protein
MEAMLVCGPKEPVLLYVPKEPIFVDAGYFLRNSLLWICQICNASILRDKILLPVANSA